MSNRAIHTFVGPLFQIREPGKSRRAWKWAYSVVQSYGSPFTIKFDTRVEASAHRAKMLKSNEPHTYPVSSHKVLTGVQAAINQVYEDGIKQTYEPPLVVIDSLATIQQQGVSVVDKFELPHPDSMPDGWWATACLDGQEPLEK